MATSCVTSLLLSTFFLSLAGYHAEITSPNIILFLVDDLGFGDLGCYGNKTAMTPNIDGLCDDGVHFTRMYSHATCTPSRASLLTGRLAVRQGLLKGSILPFDVLMATSSDAGLPHDETTIAEILQSQGYSTAMFGKWHLGIGNQRRFLPNNHGFDYFMGTPMSHASQCSKDNPGLLNVGLFVRFVLVLRTLWLSALACPVFLWLIGILHFKTTLKFLIGEFITSLIMYTYLYAMLGVNASSCILFRNRDIIEQPYSYENLTLKYTKESLNVISESLDAGKPFFLYLAYNKMHPPIFVSPAFDKKTGLGVYQDGLAEIDWSVGTILNFLKLRKVENNTLVFFLSDNGPEIYSPFLLRSYPADSRGSTGAVAHKQGQLVHLRGHKSNNWEGGIRVPAIIKWNDIIRKGLTIDAAVSLMDVLPTIVEFLNISYSPSKILDGRSLVPLIQNSSTMPVHRFIFHYCDMSRPGAVTYGQYKAHFMRSPRPIGCSGELLEPPLLYDIVNDPGESQPLELSHYSTVMSDINIAVGEHLENRRRYDSYHSSQYDYMLWPWLMPCENFPLCRQPLNSTTDTNIDEFADI